MQNDDVRLVERSLVSASQRGADDAANLSVTQVPAHRRQPGFRLTPVIIVVGDAAGGAPPSERRLITFKSSIVIGRRAPGETPVDADFLVLRDKLISSKHASITREGDACVLTDLESTNGTLVDGLPAQPRVPLREGSLILLGSHALVFRMLNVADLDAIREELASPLGPVATCAAELARICGRLRRLADSDAEILLTGETGAGKEVYAHAVHRASGRRGRFVAVNCAAIPRELVESELFGFARGAHSQARDAKQGLIEEAEGGTLFLDEIGEMSLELQTKLLRFVQDKQVAPLGTTRARQIDVRILAATSRPAVAIGSSSAGLRADLAARLGAEPIRLPPLRERVEDLGVLMDVLRARREVPFDAAAFQALLLHSWPGNVRELEKVVRTAEALARGSESITLEHLPSAIATTPWRMRASPEGRATRKPPTKIELEEVLRRCDGNMLKAARELDRKPALVYRWAKRFEIDPNVFRKKD